MCQRQPTLVYTQFNLLDVEKDEIITLQLSWFANMEQIFSLIFMLTLCILPIQTTQADFKNDERFFEFQNETILQERINFKEKCSKEFREKANNLNLDDDAKRCCDMIYTNYCYEKKYGLKNSAFQTVVSVANCTKHLENPSGMCKVDMDTGKYSQRIIGYSLCYIKNQYMTEAARHREDERLELAYYENFDKDRRYENNQTTCCFWKAVCKCFDWERKSACESAMSKAKSDNEPVDERYCDCAQIQADLEGICSTHFNCGPLILDNIKEEREFVTLTIGLAVLGALNYAIFIYCFQDDDGVRKNKPSPFKLSKISFFKRNR